MSADKMAKRRHFRSGRGKARTSALVTGAALVLSVGVMALGIPRVLAAGPDKVTPAPSGKPNGSEKDANHASQLNRDLVGHGGPVHAIQLTRTRPARSPAVSTIP